MESSILLEKKNNLSLITINRPALKNALNYKSIIELTEAVRSADRLSSTRCIMLCGSGQEAFSSGADLKELSEINTLGGRKAFFDSLTVLISTIQECKKPFIAKVHGFAMAGSMGILAASDIVLASDDAKFSLPEVKVGMIPGIVILALENVMSKRMLQYLSFSGESISAQTAKETGLVSLIFKKNELDKKAHELAESIACFSLNALGRTKVMLNRKSRSKHGMLAQRASEMAVYSLSTDCSEGISAFLKKKRPTWK